MPNHAGDAFRRYRTRNNLKQEDLAELLGVKQGTISNIERGARKVSGSTAVSIQEAIGISKADLRPDLFGEPQSEVGA